jgi:aromatic ring-opening dioxygenase LigB subunit
VLIPLWFMGGRSEPQVPAVVVSPARDRSPAEHVRAGAAIARAAVNSNKRIALIASADHGHAHDPEGPYGFDPAAAEYDARVVELVQENRLGGLLELDPALVEAAKADSWWQMLMLHGALGDGWQGEFLSYEASTYFGMLCAAYAPN